MTDLFPIGDKIYYFDLNNILRFVEHSAKNERRNKDITEVYDVNDGKKASLKQKTIKEFTAQGDIQNDNIRYDLVKTLIQYLLDSDGMAEGEDGSVSEVFNTGTMICMNTLMKEGLLISIPIEEQE